MYIYVYFYISLCLYTHLPTRRALLLLQLQRYRFMGLSVKLGSGVTVTFGGGRGGATDRISQKWASKFILWESRWYKGKSEKSTNVRRDGFILKELVLWVFVLSVLVLFSSIQNGLSNSRLCRRHGDGLRRFKTRQIVSGIFLILKSIE